MTSFSLEEAIQFRNRLQRYKELYHYEWESLRQRWHDLQYVWQDSHRLEFEQDFQRFIQSQDEIFTDLESHLQRIDRVIIVIHSIQENLAPLSENTQPISTQATTSPTPTPSSSPSEPESEKEPWGEEYFGIFNQASVEKIGSNLKGLYHIYSSDGMQYIGKSDDCIRGRLKSHLRSSTNKRLKAAVQLGTEFVFSCWESPDPKYEEAIEIKRMKGAGLLKGQRREKKPLIEYLD
jgi:hypothetical protein